MFSLERTHYYSSHIFLFYLLLLVTAKQYNLRLDEHNSPPKVIPTSPYNLKYSVPLNELTSYPIFAYFYRLDGSEVKDGSLNDQEVTVTSRSTANVDNWRISGGKLCQNTNPDVFLPMRYNRHTYVKKCGSTIGPTTLKAKVFNGTIIIDWVMHSHDAYLVPDTDRIYRIDVPGLSISIDTHPFRITTPAAKLVITKQPPVQIGANTGFTVKAEIHDNVGKVITSGLDSIAFVELTVPYRYKEFYYRKNLDMMLKHTDIRLAGKSTMIHQSTNDIIIRQQAVAGKVTFKDIRILDVAVGFRLNLTMYMARDPWIRIPNCKTCYDDLTRKNIYESENYVKFFDLSDSIIDGIPAMAFTNPINIQSQKLARLLISHKLKNDSNNIITRNFPLPGDIKIIIVDSNNNRIYSGPDSNINLNITTRPPNACLSTDMTRSITGGLAELRGSFCSIMISVVMEITSSSHSFAVVNSPHFTVIGLVHIGHIGDFNTAGTIKSPYPHIDTFVKFAAADISWGEIPGIFEQYGMSIAVESINTNDEIEFTVQQYQMYKETHQNTDSELRGILLSASSLITKAVARNSMIDNIPVIALTEKDNSFLRYNLFNKICWGWPEIYSFFLRACKARRWLKITSISSSGRTVDIEFFNKAQLFDIKIAMPVVVPEFDSFTGTTWQPEFYGEAMRSLKDAGTKIIICFSTRSLPYILRSGIRFGVSALDGYQWLFISEDARSFPLMNEGVCQWEPKCTYAYRGSLLFIENYNFGNFRTERWLHTLERFYSIDRTEYLGSKAIYPNEELASYLALGYDAMWLLAQAISNIVSRQKTAFGDEISNELKKINLNGLSGKVRLDETGKRSDFRGSIILINPIGNASDSDPNLVALPIRLVLYKESGEVEVNYQAKYPLNKPPYNYVLPPMSLPMADTYNIRKYSSISGMISAHDNILAKAPNEPWPSIGFRRREKVVTPFRCKQNCGNLISQDDVTVFNNGVCIAENVCVCNKGYLGDGCMNVSCSCVHGGCNTPDVCTCKSGWKGPRCDQPVCNTPCLHGKCVKPDKCQCRSSMWLGKYCSIHLAAILVPVICSLVLLICFIYLLIRYLIKRIQLRTALANLEWLVIWDEAVKIDSQEKDSKNVSTATHVSRMFNDLYTWKREKWFVKRFNSRTVDLDDEAVRLEMVELTTLNHKNLIIYGGACLTYPNVSFFLEPANKGSLEDILINDAIQLGWDFRFSFLKDICCGMDFIHSKTNIGSHGRLKSSNCLLDNRWCIRLSGFGGPSIRYGQYLMAGEEKDWQYELLKMNELFWTAPELLITVECLNDVQMGTKEGDVYSFGIIASEIATRDIPYAYERMFLSVSAILDLIVEKDSPLLEDERKVWQSIGGDIFVIRPQLKSEHLPEGKTTQRKFLKMLDDVWNDEPLLRPPFSKLLVVLDNIHPTKGELMDNLIRLLESYSNNLEQVVIERTHDLEVEKAKIDHIISQMLPKKVVEELKHGNKVEPEDFNCVTVFYSDIVGFTTIAKNSQPMQVVDLLNNLYSTFDSILHKYDVYKVETIGDAYVVASGVPERNGNAHAGEITTAAMDLVITMLAMKVPHLPDCKLLLRIGAHSGPVVAGVVGLKMPRYTLFGDTMLIAATMESTSEPLRIQLSEHTVKILDQLGGYETELRGEMTVAGRALTTFWLISKDGYEGTLPQVASK
ncbi:receptor-type guanylate cyclase gcy-4-like [Octopus vulgaris]|uniref:guanylate cyclase n=2 Tax=Octopus TaxID=6643 RepID=A0AA36FEQ7_OCTVU|nr:receptor-type guanylate cyclase gcy-4-like [Octopus vulgaris]